MRRTLNTIACSLLLAIPGWAAQPALAPVPGPAEGEEESKDEDAEEDEEDEEEEEEWFALIGGDVHTGTGAVLRGATVLSRDGRIEEIGYDLWMPEETERLEVHGLRVYPGLVAVESSGLLGTSKDFADGVDPFSRSMILGLASGITTTGQSNSALKLKRGEIDGVVLREDFRSSQSWSSQNPSNRRGLREKLAAAAEYLRKYRQWEVDKKEDKELKEPTRRGVDTNALKILRGEVLAGFKANEREVLLGIARLAQEFGFRPVIEGCVEGWTVSGELGRAGVLAILTPRQRVDKDERYQRPGGSSIENAAILSAAGVQVAIVPGSKGVSLGGIVGRDIMHLPIEAGFAIRGGLSERDAFSAITIVPARILGVDHRVGTIEVGKDCDLIVTDGDVLHYETFVQYTVVEGKLVYDKEEELFFAHIRPRPESEVAPETRVDAGEEPDEEAAPEEENGENGEGEEAEEEEDDGDDEGEEDEDKDEDEDEDEG